MHNNSYAIPFAFNVSVEEILAKPDGECFKSMSEKLESVDVMDNAVLNEMFADNTESMDSFSSSFKTTASDNYTCTSNYKNQSNKSKLNTEYRQRKRRIKPTVDSDELVFDKLPNYYTALSIPALATAGCMAHSSSDLVSEFCEQDPSPDRSRISMLDKIPAYQSSFTNSIRYDDTECSGVSFDEASQDYDTYEDFENDSRFGRSSDNWCSFDNYESSSLGKSLQSESRHNLGDTSRQNSKHVSLILVYYWLCCWLYYLF